jgi:hemoglobin
VNSPSAVFPETPEQRAANARAIGEATGLSDAVLECVVRSFYGTAREDPILAPLFAHVADWEAHIATITAFWSSVALMSGRYHGQPMAAHLPLPLEPTHFIRWLELFEQTVRAVCTPEGAEHLMVRARRIAQSLEMGLEVQRGILPGAGRSLRQCRPHHQPSGQSRPAAHDGSGLSVARHEI